MCFAPYISVSTFIVELLLAVYFFLLDSKDKLNRFIALLSLSLGIYQLNEFFICTTTTGLFTRSAFAVTAVLPAMAITYALIMWRKRLKWHLHAMIYLPAVFFVVAFSLPWSFKSAATCQSVFIQYYLHPLLGKFYGLYYLTYLFAAVVLFYFAAANAKSEVEKRLFYLGILGIAMFVVPTYLFLIFLPGFKLQFPSVLCEFALLLAIELCFVAWYKERHKLYYR